MRNSLAKTRVLVSPTRANESEVEARQRRADEDNRLYSAWLAGDEAAFERLVVLHGPSVRRFLEFYLGDSTLAEEAWSDTFLKVVRARTSYTPGGNFKGWLITIARRAGQDIRRSKTRWFRLLTHRRESTADRVAAPVSTDTLLISIEEAERVQRALASLSEERRTVLLLTYQQDLNSVEIADILGIDSQQVRSRLTYARRLLKEALSSSST
jgi:RNA polymerase sigma-70 factor (ECF subfamily)